MAFEAWDQARYRSANSDELEERRSAILEQAESAAPEVGDDALAEESRMCSGEIERRNSFAGLRAANVARVSSGAGRAVASFGSGVEERGSDGDGDPTCTVEYRSAFMEYMGTGRRSDLIEEMRADANTLTSDVSAVVPTVLVNKIIEKAESYGMILPLVTKTSYPAGMEIPVASIKPVATWVGEGASSDRQKATADQKVVFTHHKLRCEISMSMEVHVMTLPAFEAAFVEKVARAMVVAKEKAIVNGTGSGQPKGILKETPEAGQEVVVKGKTPLDYKLMCACEAAVPAAFESTSKWFMTKKTFFAFQAITDSQGQPVARVNYGIGGKPERLIMGREVVLADEYLPNYELNPASDTVFAFIFDPSDYVLNTNYDMGVSRKQDWDTEDMLVKAVTACDGKVANKQSLVTVKVTHTA